MAMKPYYYHKLKSYNGHVLIISSLTPDAIGE